MMRKRSSQTHADTRYCNRRDRHGKIPVGTPHRSVAAQVGGDKQPLLWQRADKNWDPEERTQRASQRQQGGRNPEKRETQRGSRLWIKGAQSDFISAPIQSQ